MRCRCLNSVWFAALLLFAGGALAEGRGTVVAKSELALDKLQRTSHKKVGKNLFAAKSWGGATRRHPQSRDAAVVAPQIAAPVEPVAPPLPFSYIGKMLDEESGKLVLYLSKGDVPYSVSVGDLIDGIYRVEGVSEAEVTLIYVPLNVKQVLIIGESNS
jgi:hypothetical protein